MAEEEKRYFSPILVEPGLPARVVVIEDSAEGIRAILGGDWEHTFPFVDSVFMLYRSEAAYHDLPRNRALIRNKQPYDLVRGPFLLCSNEGENFTSLPPELMKKYLLKYKVPDLFIPSPFGHGTMLLHDENEYRSIYSLEDDPN